jgi:hypothetical protein
MPESDALTMQRTPDTKPMPAMMPAPGTLRVRSGWSCPSPASDAIGRNGAPGSSSNATRSRGSSWWRLAKRGAEACDAATARSSWPRSCVSRSSMAACCDRKISLVTLRRVSMEGMTVKL